MTTYKDGIMTCNPNFLMFHETPCTLYKLCNVLIKIIRATLLLFSIITFNVQPLESINAI